MLFQDWEGTPGARPLHETQETESVPGEVVFCTCDCISAGQAPSPHQSAASLRPQPVASLPYVSPSAATAAASPTCGFFLLYLQDSTMGFSSELCGPQGHGAVQQMQEAELRLLEGMRKWMAQRVKSDREYAGLLHHMSLQDCGAQRRGSLNSPISQVGFRRALSLLIPFPPSPQEFLEVPGISVCPSFPEDPWGGLEIRQARPWTPLSLSHLSRAAVLGRKHQPDGGPEPVAEAARGRSELRAPQQAKPAYWGAAAAAQDLWRAVAAAAAGAIQGGWASGDFTWPLLPTFSAKRAVFVQEPLHSQECGSPDHRPVPSSFLLHLLELACSRTSLCIFCHPTVCLGIRMSGPAGAGEHRFMIHCSQGTSWLWELRDKRMRASLSALGLGGLFTEIPQGSSIARHRG